MNGIALLNDWIWLVITSVTRDVENTTKDSFTDWDGDRGTGIDDVNTALQTFCGDHGHRADPTVTKMALNFADQACFFATDFVVDFEGVVDLRQLA